MADFYEYGYGDGVTCNGSTEHVENNILKEIVDAIKNIGDISPGDVSGDDGTYDGTSAP